MFLGLIFRHVSEPEKHSQIRVCQQISFTDAGRIVYALRRWHADRAVGAQQGQGMIETCIRISAPHFVAGIVFYGDRPERAAPILNWMKTKGMTPKQVIEYCRKKGYGVVIWDRSMSGSK